MFYMIYKNYFVCKRTGLEKKLLLFGSYFPYFLYGVIQEEQVVTLMDKLPPASVSTHFRLQWKVDASE